MDLCSEEYRFTDRIPKALVCAAVLAIASMWGCSSEEGSYSGVGGNQGGTGAPPWTAASGGVDNNGGTTTGGNTQGRSTGGGIAIGGSAGSGTIGGWDMSNTARSASLGGSVPGGAKGGESQASNPGPAGTGSGGGVVVGGTAGGDTSGDGGRTAAGGTGIGGRTATGGVTFAGGRTAGTTGIGGSTPAGGRAGAGESSRVGGNTDSSNGTSPIKVWMAGDSTMSGDGSCAPDGGWGNQFKSVFNGSVTVVNLSKAGRSIQTWLYEKAVSSTLKNGECELTSSAYSDNWNSMLDANTGMKAGDYLFVEFGINDSTSTCPRHVGGALFQKYLVAMAAAAAERGAHAVFLTSASYIDCNGSTARANRGFGAETKAAGTTANVPVIDVTTLSAALYTSAGLCPNDGNYGSTTSKVGQFFCNDHTHFEKRGALQIARMVGSSLKTQGIGLAAYLAN